MSNNISNKPFRGFYLVLLVLFFILSLSFITYYFVGDNSADSPAAPSQVEMQEAGMPQTDESTPDRTLEVRKAVQGIYDHVARQYNDGTTPDGGDLCRQYCTDSFIELNRRVTKLCNATQDIGPMDADRWVMAQDYEDVSFKVEAAEMTADKAALVDITITSLGQSHPGRILVMHEHGMWKIDDFYFNYNGKWISERKMMEDYLK